MSEEFNNVAKLFWLYFCARKAKITSQAQNTPEIFVNFTPEPDPKSPARFTTLNYSQVNISTLQKMRLKRLLGDPILMQATLDLTGFGFKWFELRNFSIFWNK